LSSDAPVTFRGKSLAVKDAVLLPRPSRKVPILIGGNGVKRSIPLAAKYADEWNGVFIDVPTYRERNSQLDALLDTAGRARSAVKRSLMCPFAWAAADDGIAKLESYIESGCQRFMLQITEYDHLDGVEAWADKNLKRFH
jgi:alkanesulfonate monooxygenase SsuD/methylene tetrahydromethanopterin reductase-like flavin-dependent oxidoreductase (luciferase family)